MKRESILLIIIVLLLGVGGVIAATYFPSNQTTYDNSYSGMTSTNVQGAIDELYNVCSSNGESSQVSIGNQEVKVVTSDDGLYKDEYIDGRYLYRGTNPDNYLTFNGEAAGWRIISIEKDGAIKIRASESKTYQEWNGDAWTKPSLWFMSTLNVYLNEDYYNGLNSIAQRMIDINTFDIGSITINDSLENQIKDEKISKWRGKIGLISVSEYIRANSNISGCGSYSVSSSNNCKTTNWMNVGGVEWTITPRLIDRNNDHYNYLQAFIIYRGGLNWYDAYDMEAEVMPVLYLSSDVKIIGGDGSQNNPFELSL